MKYWIFPLLPLLSLSVGCAWFSDDKGIFVDKSDDYLNADENPALTIPDGLDTARVQDPFPIPEITDRLRPEYYPKRPPRPDAIYSNDNRDEVRIQRLGERRWLVIPEPPTTVWPKVKQFLAENGVSIAWESPSDGRLDTESLEVTDQGYRDVIRQLIRDGKADAAIDGGLDRLRIRVEPGLRERTTEVNVRYENSDFATPGSSELVELDRTPSHVPEIEQSALTELGAYIAARVAEQTVSMVAQDIATGVKSNIEIDADGDPVLRLRLDRERAWATVGQALSRATIEIEESDEPTGIYRIRVPEDLDVEAGKKGFFGRLFSFGDDTRELELRLEPADGNSFVVTALDGEGQALEREFGQQVLVLIREYAS
ncbi:MAG: outer membrane protein assembly factor BamC [Pseudomonadales bacterium]